MCSVNLGEALCMEIRARGSQGGETIEAVRRELDLVVPDWELVKMAARVKARGGMSFADAFCVATAQRTGAPLWTGDPETLAKAADCGCEVVDLRAAGG